MAARIDNRIHVRAKDNGDGDGLLNRVVAAEVGWELLTAEFRALTAGNHWSHETGDHELVMVVLGGKVSVESNRGSWQLGRRPDVFSGMPHALYLSRNSDLKVAARGGRAEFAICQVPSDEDHPAAMIAPADVAIEKRGGNNASRQINSIIPPGFGCQRIVCVEVFTPGGNWSSYPPHKHDTHKVDKNGNLVEADLEEIYYYKIKGADGYALQRVYTDDRSLDSIVAAHDNDVVLVPEGYHPVSAAYGYDCYYLNFLAGSAQSLACVDDPAYAWTKETWDSLDPRIPMVSMAMEEGE